MFLLHPGSSNDCFNEDLFVVLFVRCLGENSANYFDLIRRTAGYPRRPQPASPELLKCRRASVEAELAAGGGGGEKRRSRIDPACRQNQSHDAVSKKNVARLFLK